MQLSDKTLATLEPKEERVIRMHKGIGMRVLTFPEIGLQFSLTVKEVKNTIANALKKLKKLN